MKVLLRIQKTKNSVTLTEWSAEVEIDEHPWRGNCGLIAHRLFKQYEEEVGLKDGWLYQVLVDTPEVVLSCQK
jgi:hypothetical protein